MSDINDPIIQCIILEIEENLRDALDDLKAGRAYWAKLACQRALRGIEALSEKPQEDG